jgi:hypothetical protein
MARRSPLNERYQKYTGPQGKTRKSAAAAKPKKASSGGSAKAPAAKPKSSAAAAAAMRNPDTPEFKAIRKRWWISLIAGLVLTGVSYFMRFLKVPWASAAAALTLGVAYGTIIYAFYVDWTKMRPMRKAAYELAKTGKLPKTEKPAKRTAEKSTAEKATMEKTTTEKFTVEDSDDE